MSPAHVPGNVSFHVHAPGQVIRNGAISFSYDPLESLARASVSEGPPQGGAVVTVTSAAFRPEPSACRSLSPAMIR